MTSAIILVIAGAVFAYLLIRWLKGSVLKRMASGVELVKLGTYWRLKRRYLLQFDEDFAGFLAAAVSHVGQDPKRSCQNR